MSEAVFRALFADVDLKNLILDLICINDLESANRRKRQRDRPKAV